MKKIVSVAVSLIIILHSAAAFAGGGKDAAIIGDTLLVRPLGIASIAVGTAFFIASLPFAIISGSVDETAQELIVKPVRFTFTRPLGDFQSQSTDGYQMSGVRKDP